VEPDTAALGWRKTQVPHKRDAVAKTLPRNDCVKIRVFIKKKGPGTGVRLTPPSMTVFVRGRNIVSTDCLSGPFVPSGQLS